jgi:hypothetical protein
LLGAAKQFRAAEVCHHQKQLYKGDVPTICAAQLAGLQFLPSVAAEKISRTAHSPN